MPIRVTRAMWWLKRISMLVMLQERVLTTYRPIIHLDQQTILTWRQSLVSQTALLQLLQSPWQEKTWAQNIQNLMVVNILSASRGLSLFWYTTRVVVIIRQSLQITHFCSMTHVRMQTWTLNTSLGIMPQAIRLLIQGLATVTRSLCW